MKKWTWHGLQASPATLGLLVASYKNDQKVEARRTTRMKMNSKNVDEASSIKQRTTNQLSPPKNFLLLMSVTHSAFLLIPPSKSRGGEIQSTIPHRMEYKDRRHRNFWARLRELSSLSGPAWLLLNKICLPRYRCSDDYLNIPVRQASIIWNELSVIHCVNSLHIDSSPTRTWWNKDRMRQWVVDDS